jgi:hypothetical protein
MREDTPSGNFAYLQALAKGSWRPNEAVKESKKRKYTRSFTFRKKIYEMSK